MRIPAIRGVIKRRFLVNYRIDPVVVSRILPKPFSPKLHEGMRLGGYVLFDLRR